MSDNTIEKREPGKLGQLAALGNFPVPQFFVDLAKNAPAMMWVFTWTTFLSALLLFAIQPMFAKMVLPVLGGSPSVWAVAVFFFQSALLVGYVYAHFLINKAPAHLTGLIHLAVCVVALICLPIGLSKWWGEPPPGEPYFWQFGLFTVAIGLPFMAVSANAPLTQAWFARTGHPNARDPYFLYAASNLGSLIALLGYPFVLEPAFGLTSLSEYWSYGYVLLVLSLAVSFFLMRGAQASGASEAASAVAPGEATAGAEPTWQQRLGWVGLALVPSGLVTAYTVHVTTDVASAPLLWVIPLALYLLTFVLVFRDKPLISRESLLFLHLVALVVALITISQTRHDNWFVTSSTGVAAFFTTAMLAHRTLYEARPAARYLTEFYLWMSLGGALGGMFAALVAPKIFNQIYEYPILLALSMACRPGALNFSRDNKSKDEIIILWLILAVGVLAIAWLPTLAANLRLPLGEFGTTPLVVMFLGAILLASVHYPPRQLVAAALMCAALIWLPSGVQRGELQRSFFGVYRVQTSADGAFHILIHGTTLHGAQRFRDDDGRPVDDTTPGTYYYPGSPIGQTVLKRREVLGNTKGRYGVVGLGSGSTPCHAKPGESWRIFEIDPVVIRIAKNPKNFTFLAKCQPNADIVVGDARLTMAREDNESYDLFVIDAFSSDAIPVHLMTKEAIEMYLNKLKPDGVVLLHVSNCYLDLELVLGAILKELPAGTAGIAVSDSNADGSYAQSTSSVVIFAKSAEALEPYRSFDGVSDLDDGGLRGWTDDYSDILGPFMNKFRGRG